MAIESNGHVVAFTGGVGGAKLALGLYHMLPPDELAIVCNTGDDFEHLGLHIAPDVDTVTYTLAGLNSSKRGWGRRNESWTFMKALAALGGDTWFQLGDGDLATHVERTRRLRSGETLAAITGDFAARLGVTARIMPMTNDPVRTVVLTDGGALDFQEYFVRAQCLPRVEGFEYRGAATAAPVADLLRLLESPALRAVVICPSNPFLSIDPIFAIPDILAAVTSCRAPVVAVSPIVAGRALKGPTAKIFAELGNPAGPGAVATHYGDLIDGLVIDTADRKAKNSLKVHCRVAPSVMRTLRDKKRLAHATLGFADMIRDTAKGPPAH